MPGPLVSICIPTRNRCASLHRSLGYITQLDYPTLDILVSDNGSEDGTEQVCREFMQNDSRIRYVRHHVNKGLHANHNFCMDSARGEFLCVFHDHDKHDSTIVRKYIDFMTAHPSVGVVCSNWDLIDDAGRRLGVREFRGSALTAGTEYITQTIRSGRSSIGIPGAMIRVTALGETRFDEAAPIGFGDFPMWFRVAERWDVGHLHDTLWSWRQNRESNSARPIVAIADDYETNIGRYCDEYLGRHPSDVALVARWRQGMKRYLFWALVYEIALHFRQRDATTESDERSLFEIMQYRLSDDQFAHALEKLRAHRSGFYQSMVVAALESVIALRLTAGLGWLAGHQATMRSWLRLE